VFQAVHAGNMAVGDDRRGPQQLLWNFDSSKETQVSGGGHSSMGLVLHSIGSSFGTPTSTENPMFYGLPVHYHQVPLTSKAWVGCTVIGHSTDRLHCQKTLIGQE